MSGDAPEVWSAPAAAGPVSATVTLPGSKSLTNRALVLAALSETDTRITAPLRARDSDLMVGALRRLGVRIADVAADWHVTGGGLSGAAGQDDATVDCGLAGTVMRFVPPLAALLAADTRFDGDPHARTRPMGTLLDGLRQAGVEIADDGRGLLPFTVRGTGSVAGGRVAVDAGASSQFVSALLLAGARFERGLDLVHTGPTLPSLPHIEMTEVALRAAGVSIERTGAARWQVAPGPIDSPDIVIEPDLSNAVPFLAAALVTGGTVRVPHWPAHTTQPGAHLQQLLAAMGAEVSLDDTGLTVTGRGGVRPLVADLSEASELTPVLAALCALADGESRISGVAHIRGHETDRLAALRTELAAVGARVRETEDGLVIAPATLRPALWHAYADHRMAQAGALLGLAVPGLQVDDIAATTKTMTDFVPRWSAMLAGSAPAPAGAR